MVERQVLARRIVSVLVVRREVAEPSAEVEAAVMIVVSRKRRHRCERERAREHGAKNHSLFEHRVLLAYGSLRRVRARSVPAPGWPEIFANTALRVRLPTDRD